MTLIRAGLLALFAAHVATAAIAAPVVAGATVDPQQTAAEAAARKGTRAYRPGEAAATAPVATAPAKNEGASQADKIAQCMETWDTGTHITKNKWREICKRQLNDR